MLIENLRSENHGDTTRVSADVTWESCDRPCTELYFETVAEFAKDLVPNPNAFLIAAALPAMRHGEKRIAIQGAICPSVRNGLNTAIQILGAWYGAPRNQVVVEPTQGFIPSPHNDRRRVGFFFSGGVDSMATLRANRLDFPLDHPASIKDGIFVHGFDIGPHFPDDFTSLIEPTRT